MKRVLSFIPLLLVKTNPGGKDNFPVDYFLGEDFKPPTMFVCRVSGAQAAWRMRTRYCLHSTSVIHWRAAMQLPKILRMEKMFVGDDKFPELPCQVSVPVIYSK